MRRAGTAVSDPSDRVLAYVRGDSMGRVTQVASNPPPGQSPTPLVSNVCEK